MIHKALSALKLMAAKPFSRPMEYILVQKLRKLVLPILSLTIFFAPSPAQAVEYIWFYNVRVVSVEPSLSGHVWVRINTGNVNCASVGGPTSRSEISLSQNDLPVSGDGFALIYSTLLTAKAAGSLMNIRVTGSIDGHQCVIERIRVL